MDVDPREVDSNPASRSVELGSSRRQRLRPGSFVPAVADDHLCIGMMPGVRCDPLHGVVPASCIVQAKTCHDLAGLDEMHMGIDKGGRNQPIVKINFGLPRRCTSPPVTTAVAPGKPGAYTRPPTRITSQSGMNLFGSDLRAVLERNREDRRGVGGHFSL